MARAPVKKTTKKGAAKSATPRIVAAAGAASASKDGSRAKAVEQAMADAINQALADGVTDPVEQKKRMMAAREKALRGA